MKLDAMATRLSVLTRALPLRILIVDGDAAELELLAKRLAAAGFQTSCAANGQEALEQLSRRWHPVVITAWEMPVTDGLEFTRALRRDGHRDVYVIMRTARGAAVDFERGYLAGVDDYIMKKAADAELFARINAAFNTLALRRSLKEVEGSAEDSVSIDAESGAFAPRELSSKLHSEIRRAQRYGRRLSVLVVNVRDEAGRAPPPALLRSLVQTMDSSVRAHVDWIGRLATDDGASFAVVLPEASLADAPTIKGRLMNELLDFAAAHDMALEFDVGVAALDSALEGDAQVDAAEMLDVALHCLSCPGRAGPEQLRTLQLSVGSRVGILCRHGYAVDNECSLKVSGAERAVAES
jgi:PleD family two-component response regulator